MKEVNVFVSGCTGRMGKMVVDLVNQHPGWKVVGGFGLGEHQYDFPVFDVGNFLAVNQIKKANIVIDFSNAVASEFVFTNLASEYQIPMVCATTKLAKKLIRDMQTQKRVPVFQAYNMAQDVYAFSKAVCSLVASLSNCDIDVFEVHHTGKKDAPSGTAENLAVAINEALGDTHIIMDNPPFDNPRGTNEIHVHSTRAGKYPGTHKVMLTGSDYCIELEHTAFSPMIFAEGAVKAAEFLLEQKPGYYNMDSLCK